MKQFLVVYRRSSGLLKEFKELAGDRQNSSRQRVEAELVAASDPDLEVVVLNSESEENLRKTHSRYFLTADRLIPAPA